LPAKGRATVAARLVCARPARSPCTLRLACRHCPPLRSRQGQPTGAPAHDPRHAHPAAARRGDCGRVCDGAGVTLDRGGRARGGTTAGGRLGHGFARGRRGRLAGAAGASVDSALRHQLPAGGGRAQRHPRHADGWARPRGGGEFLGGDHGAARLFPLQRPGLADRRHRRVPGAGSVPVLFLLGSHADPDVFPHRNLGPR